ncbi:hypothetical protein ACFYW8_44215 [Streptomyces sp. NPDC002742]|uniref:hypothetical protein n=1 Tax=Streptomyces sp. NPDC002742 TaxID=3364663 RepID=UPI0036AE766C
MAIFVLVGLIIGLVTGGATFLVGCISNQIGHGVCTTSWTTVHTKREAAKDVRYFTTKAKRSGLHIKNPSRVELDNGLIWLTVPISNDSGAAHSIRAEIGITYEYVKGDGHGKRRTTATCTAQPNPYVVEANSAGEYSFTVCSDSDLDAASGFRHFRPRITEIDGFPAEDPRDVFSKLRVKVSAADPAIVQQSSYQDGSVLACRVSVTNLDSVPHSIELDGQYFYAYTSREGYIHEDSPLPRDENELSKIVPAGSATHFTNPPYENAVPSGYLVVPLDGKASQINEAEMDLTLSLKDPGDDNGLVAPYAKFHLPAGCHYRSG